MKPYKRTVMIGAAVSLISLGLTSSGCVDPYAGSNIQITFFNVHVPGPTDPADSATFGRPPVGTHYAFYAVRQDPDVGQSFAFEVDQFEINPVVNTTSPCFIEIARTDFPGLHSTQIVAKLREVTGLAEGDEFTADANQRDATRILTAETRLDGQQLLQNTIKAVTSHSPFRPAAPGALCANQAGYDPAAFPRNDCTDDDSNRIRLEKCTALFRDHPDYYEGNDQVFTLPLNGAWRGAVDVQDPRNGQLYGGAGFFVDANLEFIDSLLVNYQYNCTVADFNNPDIGPSRCQPQVPSNETFSPIGVHYMSGEPLEGLQRGVMRISLQNRVFANVRAQAGIWVDLDDDDVNF